MTTILGVVTASVAFGAGTLAGLYLRDAYPESLATVTDQSATTRTPSPTPLETIPPTATSTRVPLPSPTLAGTAATPFVVPQTLPSSTPQVPFVADDWEPDDSAEEASSIEVGESQSHNLHAEGDHDWLCFEATSGTTYAIQTFQLGREIDTVLTLYDAAGKQLATDDDGGEEFLSSLMFWMPEEDGSLCVVIRSFSDTVGGRGTEYDVSVRLAENFRIDEYEPDGSRARASHIEVGETQWHNRHVSGDVDWMLFEAQSGTTYVIKTSNLGNLVDTAVYLYDGQGNELAFDEDSGGEMWASRLRWTAPTNAVFYIKVVDRLQGSAGPGTGYDVSLSAR